MSRARVRGRHKPPIVGVTGHRPNSMPERHWARIKRNLAEAMTEIEASCSGGRPELMSGLAEGADRLAAFVALRRGWSLRAVLAFHRSRFEQDFSDCYAIGEFRALLEASDQVEEPGRKAHVGKPAEHGYDAVGRRLIGCADVLIAIWDGKGSQGKGGTIEVIERARKKGTRVVWIHATKAQSPRLLPPLGSVKAPPNRMAVARRQARASAR